MQSAQLLSNLCAFHRAAAFLHDSRNTTLSSYCTHAPQAGESFFQEGLIRWRETNLSEAFLALARDVTPLCTTLPLLVLHQRSIVDALIARLVPDAALALEPVCSLAGLLARDLRGDFLPHVKPLVHAFVSLLDAGADKEPDYMVRIDTALCLAISF